MVVAAPKLSSCRKIAVIGTSCGGKSSLCDLLSSELELPLFTVDKHQWRAGWQRVPDADLAARHDEFVSGDAWIVDGWGVASTLEPRLHKADLIILVEHPLGIHFWWMLKRAARSLFRQDPHFNEGCPPHALLLTNLKIIWDSRRHLPALSETLAAHAQKLLRISSPGALDRLMLHLRHGTELRLRVD